MARQKPSLEIDDGERCEIARLIEDGVIGGILDNEDGTRVNWHLDMEKFDNN